MCIFPMRRCTNWPIFFLYFMSTELESCDQLFLFIFPSFDLPVLKCTIWLYFHWWNWIIIPVMKFVLNLERKIPIQNVITFLNSHCIFHLSACTQATYPIENISELLLHDFFRNVNNISKKLCRSSSISELGWLFSSTNSISENYVILRAFQAVCRSSSIS